jgi:type I restriction enzyme R subunit
MLDVACRSLRDIIKLIELKKRPHIYTDFEDEFGRSEAVELHGVAVGTDMHRFQLKVRHFLKEHENHLAIQKLRRNEPLTAQDLEELERVIVEAGVAEREDLDKVKADVGFGVFIRSLVGLDRETAKHACDGFQAVRALPSSQIEFLIWQSTI